VGVVRAWLGKSEYYYENARKRGDDKQTHSEVSASLCSDPGRGYPGIPDNFPDSTIEESAPESDSGPALDVCG
jgi:hypothetical protein